MKLAIVHYHLRRGGVTSVIENTLAALAGHDTEAVVLTGERPPDDFPGRTAVVDGLGYRETPGHLTALELSSRLAEGARDVLGGPPDLWHIHNPTLGKNVLFTGALHDLASHGARMLLQIHDFAEDGRPANFGVLTHGLTLDLPHPAYFTSPQIHYAVLNGRDLNLLQEAGFPSSRLHLLPNPIPSAAPAEDDPALATCLGDRRLWLYPTRGIRRKNLGELILWSLLSDRENNLFGTTLTPENPQQRPAHDRWQAFAQEHNLPVALGLVDQQDFAFPALMHRAHAHLTTSVAEGFGLAFLEPWTYDKPLAGRNLPAITQDFDGVHLAALYDRLLVPTSWIPLGALRQRLADALTKAYQTYGVALPDEALERALGAIVDGDLADFGALDEPAQEAVCAHLAQFSADARHIQPPALEPLADPATVTFNREHISSTYSLDQYGKRLRDLYQPLLDAPAEPAQPLDSAAVLRAFLDPARFHLLRT